MFLRLQLPSTTKVLKRIIGADLMREILCTEPDWKLHFGIAASRLNISEASLMKAIAEILHLGWDGLNSSPPITLETNSPQVGKKSPSHTWEDMSTLAKHNSHLNYSPPLQIVKSFLQVGAFPLYTGSELCGTICIDPFRLSALLNRRSRRLIKLTSYGRLLTYSAPFLEPLQYEQVPSPQGITPPKDINSLEIPSKKLRQVLQLIQTESHVFKSDCRIITQDQSRLAYQFITPEGELAEGTISPDIRADLLAFLNKSLSEGKQISLSKECYAIVTKEEESLTIQFTTQLENNPLPQTTEPLRSDCVLVLEDDPIFSKVTGLLLQDNGYSHEITSNPFEAISKIRSLKAHPLAILCDIQLAKGSGLEFIHAVRNDPQLKDLNIIALTSIEDPLLPLRAGADIFIRKSDGPELLLAYLSRLRARTNQPL